MGGTPAEVIRDWREMAGQEIAEIETNVEAAALGYDPQREVLETFKKFEQNPETWRESPVFREVFEAQKQDFKDKLGGTSFFEMFDPETGQRVTDTEALDR